MFNIVYYMTREIQTLYELPQQLLFVSLYWYIINVINIRLFVYSIFIFLPQNIRSCFAHFWAWSKSSNYLQQKHGVMAVKGKMIPNLVWQKFLSTYRNSSKFASESTLDL